MLKSRRWLKSQQKKNRIVFEGMVFDVEKKTTRTGRHIINFKMTDYTSSFAMQKWAKDDEELKKCDMIAKGSWLRVRGNIENNNFTHALTMNVQDVKEIIHHDRKDLMPEDQKTCGIPCAYEHVNHGCFANG